MTTSAWVLGLHLLSAHTSPGYNTITPGIYVVHESGVTAGYLRNSLGRSSVYAAWTWKAGDFSLTTGGITGYPKAKVLPMVVPSYSLTENIRISVIPNPWGATALHLSMERRF